MSQANNSSGNHTAVNQMQHAGFSVVTLEMMAADGGVVRRRNACVECSRRRRKVVCQFVFSRASVTLITLQCERANGKVSCAYCMSKNIQCEVRTSQFIYKHL